nr:hypothetical protein [Tanacetum cinerariifolium]
MKGSEKPHVKQMFVQVGSSLRSTCKKYSTTKVKSFAFLTISKMKKGPRAVEDSLPNERRVRYLRKGKEPRTESVMIFKPSKDAMEKSKKNSNVNVLSEKIKSLLNVVKEHTALEAEKDKLEAVEALISQEIKTLKCDMVEVVSNVVPFVAIDLVHSDEMEALLPPTLVKCLTAMAKNFKPPKANGRGPTMLSSFEATLDLIGHQLGVYEDVQTLEHTCILCLHGLTSIRPAPEPSKLKASTTLILSAEAARYITNTSPLSGAQLLRALKNGSDLLAPFKRNRLSAAIFPLRLRISLSVLGGLRSVITLTFKKLSLIPFLVMRCPKIGFLNTEGELLQIKIRADKPKPIEGLLDVHQHVLFRSTLNHHVVNVDLVVLPNLIIKHLVDQPLEPPLLDFVPKPVYPEFMPHEDDMLPAKEQLLPVAVSPTAYSPSYITKSDPEEDLKEHDEDLEEDPADYPTDIYDDEEEEDSSKDDVGNVEEEEHIAPTDSVPPPAYRTTARMYVRAQTPIPFLSKTKVSKILAIPTPPPSPLTSYSLLDIRKRLGDLEDKVVALIVTSSSSKTISKHLLSSAVSSSAIIACTRSSNFCFLALSCSSSSHALLELSTTLSLTAS